MSDGEILKEIERYLDNRLEEWLNSTEKDEDLSYYNTILEDQYIANIINELRGKDMTTVNTTVTMPKYLKDEAVKHNINFSNILQKEIKNILKGDDR